MSVKTLHRNLFVIPGFLHVGQYVYLEFDELLYCTQQWIHYEYSFYHPVGNRSKLPHFHQNTATHTFSPKLFQNKNHFTKLPPLFFKIKLFYQKYFPKMLQLLFVLDSELTEIIKSCVSVIRFCWYIFGHESWLRHRPWIVLQQNYFLLFVKTVYQLCFC